MLPHCPCATRPTQSTSSGAFCDDVALTTIVTVLDQPTHHLHFRLEGSLGQCVLGLPRGLGDLRPPSMDLS